MNSDTAKQAAEETSPAHAAGTSSTPEKPEAVPLTESPADVRKPETAAVTQESKEPAAPGEPKANEPNAGDPAVNPAAGTGGRVNAEPASNGDRPKSEAEFKAPVEPAASTVPVEASGDPHSLSAQKNAGATGGIFVALTIVSFVLEVALLGALGIWAMTMLPFSPVVSVIIAVLPVFIFWALFMSPKANLRLSQPYHAVVAHLLFAAGSGLLAIAGQPVLAVCMGVLTAISLALTVAVRGQNVESRKKATGRRSAR
ncbi:DUF2568 domain-containing protein [Paeniglutamicibacter sp. ABSL32-1]|uniref:YrdB family protein n=1 Tax=Paeniglutamicibacter quisquiliarum TaxID=2849498 RepID=UPI001C2CCE66|nr:DUF2568 domain-containing protein [Paeniglutamicibacter quisquiliarum]